MTSLIKLLIFLAGLMALSFLTIALAERSERKEPKKTPSTNWAIIDREFVEWKEER